MLASMSLVMNLALFFVMIKNELLQMVKPLVEPETWNKVKFGYSNDQNTKKIMADLFDMDHLESAFDGNDGTGFDINKYAKRMKEEEDNKMRTPPNSLSSVSHNMPSLE